MPYGLKAISMNNITLFNMHFSKKMRDMFEVLRCFNECIGFLSCFSVLAVVLNKQPLGELMR